MIQRLIPTNPNRKMIRMKNKLNRISILNILTVLFFYSCAVDKYIPEDEHLYTGAELTIAKDSIAEAIEDINELETKLNEVLKPEPNSTFLGLRPGLHYYYKAQREKPGFINRWLNKKIGEEPVYASDVDINRIEDLLKNRLENSGFFQSQITSQYFLNDTTKRASAKYTINLSKPYTMVALKMDMDSFPAYGMINNALHRSFLRKGDRFDLDKLKTERERIDFELKRKGYYNFNPEFLIFEADTNQYKDKRFDLFLRFKDNVPKKAKIPYRLKNIYVYPDYAASDAGNTKVYDTVTIDNVHFLQEELYFKPEFLAPHLLLKQDQLYNPYRSSNTGRRLGSIGNYKFVNIRYQEIDSLQTDSIGYLNANIYLSPVLKRQLRAELQAVSKSNSFMGPALTATYSNRNLFHGGETLKLALKLGYEAQIAGGNDTGLTSIMTGIQGDLIFPRMIFFSKFSPNFSYSIPQTKISLGADYLNRSKLYTLLSANASFGYVWNANRYVTHELNPIAINYLKLSNTTEEFDQILTDNPYLQRSFEQEFISGLNYRFTYNELINRIKKGALFLELGLDTAGNSMGLFGKGDSENPDSFLGLEYAQYVKFEADLRYHFRINRKQTLAFRLFGGYGLPYGNSDILPFSKQFFSGGPYSVRAFRIRALGPGSYSPNSGEGYSYFDQAGDIKLEANVEYRFPIISFLKGALFADAGNVWLKNENDALPGGKFSSEFINEFGIGTGAGLRVEIQSFVIRFDLASPIHKPYLPKGERWDTDFGEFVFNFAIGYPF